MFSLPYYYSLYLYLANCEIAEDQLTLGSLVMEALTALLNSNSQNASMYVCVYCLSYNLTLYKFIIIKIVSPNYFIFALSLTTKCTLMQTSLL